MLAHNVFFTLKDQSDAAKAALVNACRTYLDGHPGTIFFSCGLREPALARPVNDHEFDVALMVVFATREDHDAYQVAPRHLQFTAESKPNWAKVRVFDVTCEDSSQSAPRAE